MEAPLMLVMVKFMVEYQIIFKALQFIILIFAESNHLHLVCAPQPKEKTLSPISASEGRGGAEGTRTGGIAASPLSGPLSSPLGLSKPEHTTPRTIYLFMGRKFGNPVQYYICYSDTFCSRSYICSVVTQADHTLSTRYVEEKSGSLPDMDNSLLGPR